MKAENILNSNLTSNKARDTRDLKRPRPLQRKLKGSPRNSKDLQERNSEDLQKSLRNPKDLQGTPKNSKGTPKELLRNSKGTPKNSRNPKEP